MLWQQTRIIVTEFSYLYDGSFRTNLEDFQMPHDLLDNKVSSSNIAALAEGAIFYLLSALRADVVTWPALFHNPCGGALKADRALQKLLHIRPPPLETMHLIFYE